MYIEYKVYKRVTSIVGAHFKFKMIECEQFTY